MVPIKLTQTPGDAQDCLVRRHARRSLFGLALLASLGTSPAMPASEPIEIWLWAWERPEDLRFVPPDVGVAFLAKTLVLRDGDVTHLPRRQPLHMRSGQPLVAVVRIENERGQRPATLSAKVRDRLVDRLVEAGTMDGVGGLQIDFDATRSQRADYRTLLASARARLPEQTRLSITALPSWCQFDRWVDDDLAVVDEIVPMIFEMGQEGDDVRAWVQRAGSLRSPRCKDSAGAMVGERWTVPATASRVFVFNAEPWTPSVFADVKRRLG